MCLGVRAWGAATHCELGCAGALLVHPWALGIERPLVAVPTLCREVDFVATKLRLAPHNESAWNYLRGLAALPGTPSRSAATDARWRAACEEALAAEPSCAPALALLADVYAEQAGMLGAAGGSSRKQAGEAGEAGRAAVVARRLAGQVFGKLVVADPIRAPYYQHRAAQLARA